MKKYSLYTLVLFLLGTVIIIIAFSVYLLTSNQRDRLIADKIETKISLAETIKILYSPFWVYRGGGLGVGFDTAFIKEASKFKDVLYIRIVLTDGKIIQSSINGEYGQTIKDPKILTLFSTKTPITIDEIFQGERIKSIIYPAYGDRVILVGFSLKNLDETVKGMVIHNILIGSGGLILAILAIFLVLNKGIIGPIKKMKVACDKTRSGNFNVKVDVGTKNEIGELADAFNKTFESLRESRDALEESKKVLEVKVQSRTQELRELVENQEEIIQKRTKESEKRIAELEKIHRLTVGRENKMIELKKEKEELRKELEKVKKPKDKE